MIEEQIAKFRACKTQEEMLSFAKEEGIELTEEQLEAVSGGGCFTTKCDECGSTEFTKAFQPGNNQFHQFKYECSKCHHTWYAST